MPKNSYSVMNVILLSRLVGDKNRRGVVAVERVDAADHVTSLRYMINASLKTAH